jgi:AraC-like DNA-binding protein
MHTLHWAAPNHKLRGFVRAYAQRATNLASPLIEPIPAHLEQTLEFQFGDHYEALFANGRRERSSEVMIVGAQTERPIHIFLKGRIESFGIFFHPTAFFKLFKVPVTELTNKAYHAGCVAGWHVSRLRERLGECTSFEARVEVAEAYLLEQAKSNAAVDPITQVADRLMHTRGTVSLGNIARQAGLGTRQFERKFLQSTGMTPKRFARVARFQTALDCKIFSPQKSWLEIAHMLRYHDQMHMVRDFRDLTGESPSQIFAAIGDARPVAFVGSSDPAKMLCDAYGMVDLSRTEHLPAGRS